MAYVYRHIRLDKNQPFYIGIGSQDNYSRAFSTQSRNRYWRNIVEKVGYEVEIFIDEISWEEAQKKEIEFIKLYGRKQHGGVLCNLTDGGGGAVGMIASEETRNKQSIKRMGVASPIKGTKRPQHVIDAIIKSRIGKPSWNKGVSPSKETKDKRNKSMEGKYLKGEKHPMFGRKMSDHAKEKLKIANENRPAWNKGKGGYKVDANHKKRAVLQYDLNGNFIKEYDSVCSAGGITKLNKGDIGNCCSGRQRMAYGFVWRYKIENVVHLDDIDRL